MATSNFPFSRHKYQDGRCRIPCPRSRSEPPSSRALTTPSSIPIWQRRRPSWMPSWICAQEGTVQTVARSASLFIHSRLNTIRIYSLSLSWLVEPPAAFRLRVRSIAGHKSQHLRLELELGRSLRPRNWRLALSQANANRAECVNSALKECCHCRCRRRRRREKTK